MATSQNGWPVLESNRTTGSLPRLRKWIIPGTDRHLFLRDGSAGFLLIHFALWWHEKVSPLNGGVWDEWGWAVRPVRGQVTGYSNHASGTAEDLDATQFPRGVPILRNMKPLQIARIRARLRKYEGLLGWGGDYRNTPDGMHVELTNGSTMAAVENLARRLCRTPAGLRILDANPGAAEVIWDGPMPKPPTQPKPAPIKRRRPSQVIIDHEHLSTLYRLDPAALTAYVTRHDPDPGPSRAAGRPNLFTLTEVDARDRAESLQGLGYDVTHRLGKPGMGECAILTDPDTYTIKRTWLLNLGAKVPRRGDPCYAPTVLLTTKDGGRILLSLAHLPATVERDLADGRATVPQAIAWMRSVASWRLQLAKIRREVRPHEVMVVADFNLSFKRAFVDPLLRTFWPKLRDTWTAKSMQPGTHAGDRPIDATLTAAEVVEPATVQATPPGVSDHDGYRERLRFRPRTVRS